MQTDVSIVIINFNTFQLTCDCIESLQLHTSGVTYEIILVDNASSECDADLFKQKFPFLTLIKSETNVGFARGNNLGISQAKGNYILLLNSDTVFVENSIGYIYNRCSTINDLGAATIKLIYPDGTVQPAANRFPSALLHLLLVTRLYKIFRKYYRNNRIDFNYNSNFTCDWVWGTFFFFRKEGLDAVQGKLAETYFMYSEDVEWCYNFKKSGLNNYYFADSKIIHLIGKSSVGLFKAKLVKKNHLHFIRSKFGFIPYVTEAALLKWEEFWK